MFKHIFLCTVRLSRALGILRQIALQIYQFLQIINLFCNEKILLTDLSQLMFAELTKTINTGDH